MSDNKSENPVTPTTECAEKCPNDACVVPTTESKSCCSDCVCPDCVCPDGVCPTECTAACCPVTGNAGDCTREEVVNVTVKSDESVTECIADNDSPNPFSESPVNDDHPRHPLRSDPSSMINGMLAQLFSGSGGSFPPQMVVPQMSEPSDHDESDESDEGEEEQSDRDHKWSAMHDLLRSHRRLCDALLLLIEEGNDDSRSSHSTRNSRRSSESEED